MRFADWALILLILFHLELCNGAEVARPDGPTIANANKSTSGDEFSLEDLMKIEVTSVSRKSQPLSTAPAAIAVITQEDIRRSGATSIPEALRLAPGMDVGRVDANEWAISARGFNDVFANKLLVLMDGRSIYTPLFSGVFWDVQDTFLNDIDRIEVIRGPGATLWGANAVNGVINIITKSAKDTQGGLVYGGGGTEERGFGGVRYGGKLADKLYYRLYGTYSKRDSSVTPTGADADDGWEMGRGGFRLDWEPGDSDALTFQGDLYNGRLHQVFTVPTFVPPFQQNVPDRFTDKGGNVLGRWSHAFSADSDMKLQFYYDRTVRDTTIFSESRDTGDLDFQHHFRWGERHDLVWGLGYRATHDQVANTTAIALTPDNRTTQLFNGFIQDELILLPDHLRLTAGTKIEHNDFTGVEVQPSLRLSWTPRDRHMVWASVSRAVRTPSRAEEDIVINPPGAPPGFASILGSTALDSEDLIASEIGYRVQPHANVTIDIAGFYNIYTRLRSVEPAPTPFAPFQTVLGNGLRGETYGGEIVTQWHPNSWWRLTAGYSLLEMFLHRRPGSLDTASEAAERNSPQQQIFVRSSVDLPGHVELDGSLRHIDAVPARGVPAYTELDLRVGWHPVKQLELSVVGQNLLHQHHAEFSPTSIATQRTDVEHSVYGKIVWRF